MKIIYKSLLLASFVASTTLQAELVTTYFKTGELKAQTHYLDGTNTSTKEGIKDGIEKIYYIEGPLAYEVNYVKGKRDGRLVWFDKQGRKIADRFYVHGKLEGMERTYYTNGRLKHEVRYINDKKEGMQREYFDNGRLAMEVPYKHGKKEGLQKEYTYDGMLYSEVLYKNNYKEGLQKWYDNNGHVVKTELFKMDRPVNVMKQIEEKKPDATKQLIGTIDFSPKKPQ